MPADIVAPDVPVPAPANISPVGISSTFMSIIFFWLSVSDVLVSTLTVLKKPRDLIELIDLSNNTSLNASPSSIIREFLNTFSSVIKLPNILICST